MIYTQALNTLYLIEFRCVFYPKIPFFLNCNKRDNINIESDWIFIISVSNYKPFEHFLHFRSDSMQDEILRCI
ncbi:hypothetical protein HZS_1090 [Henneguya salminicola]|nr:hypothetical protein HZS_1090 [Henneguya salminicola]